MKKFRIAFVFILALLLTFTASTIETKAATATKLVVHYHRFDPNYSGWKLWLWPYAPTAGDGADYSFNGTDEFGVYYVSPVFLAQGPKRRVAYVFHGCKKKRKVTEFDVTNFYQSVKFFTKVRKTSVFSIP